MRKTFDYINKIELAENIIGAEERHIISNPLNVSLAVRCGNSLRKNFDTSNGTPRGDSSSALAFTYYFTKIIDTVKSNQPLDYSYVEQTIRLNIVDHLIEYTSAW